jgi:Fe(3+) dicitrate transport protein
MKRILSAVMLGGLTVSGAAAVMAQDAPPAAETTAPPASDAAPVPEVEVIQEQPPAAPPQPAAAQPKPKPKPQQQAAPAPAAVPTPVAPPPDEFDEPIAEISEPAQILANSPYGASGGADAARRAQFGELSPINGRTIIPGDLQNYAGAGTRVTQEGIEEQRPMTNHEALARVPGVVTVNDDGIGRHGGIGIRGSAPRRSRKVLVMEDGQPINFAPYLDSSQHYSPPIERVENIEVLRGYVVNQGPLNNYGIVNFQNLSPFGANETVVKAGIGKTWDVDKDVNNFRHVHTRQNFENWGVVASYSGSEVGGAWDNEVLRYNDFYGAIGVKGENQDLVVSGGFFRQRDDYDEDNFLRGSFSDFVANGRRKGNKCEGQPEPSPFEASCGHDYSTYNGDHYRLQVAHNYYFDKNTTLTTRVYGASHDRARFYPGQTADYSDDGLIVDDPNTDLIDLVMEGRDRLYRNYGIDSRLEMANLPLFGGMSHDLQVGVRYHNDRFRNRNREGDNGEILGFNNRGGLEEQQNLEADAFSAFIQTAIHVTRNFTITPGLRLEHYETSFRAVVGDDEVLEFFEDFGALKSEHTEVLPGIAFSWEAAPRSTFYGSYHRGLNTPIIRDALDEPFEEALEAGEQAEFAANYDTDPEIGDNFQIGYRTTAIRGFTFDGAIFHSRIKDYQFGEAFQSDDGDRVFSAIDRVDLTGFEIGARVDTQPLTGSVWNYFAEAIYTYTDSEIKKNQGNPDSVGNEVPEAIKHYANLTLGVGYKKLWDASITATHRGGWFVDEDNTQDFELEFSEDGPELEAGKVYGQWLLSARGNLHLTDSLTLWASGQNLTNEFYLAGVEDGVKPSIGRTIMGGFTWKFD